MIRQGGLFIVVMFCVLSGCAKEKAGSKGWGSFPVTIYSDAAIAASAESESDLQEAMRFWENKAGQKLFDFKGAWTGSQPAYSGDAAQPSAIYANIIFLQNPWPYAPNIAGQTIVLSQKNRFEGSLIMVNPHTPFCTGDCADSPHLISELKVFTHELGHFLGLDHVQDPANIMYPTLDPGGSLEGMQIDQASLQSLTAT